MVKFFFIKTDDLKIFPMMVAVAGKARFPMDPRRSMKPFVLINPYFYIRMTCKAFLI